MTEERAKAAFAEWQRRHQSGEGEWISCEDIEQVPPDEYGQLAAAYFMELLAATE